MKLKIIIIAIALILTTSHNLISDNLFNSIRNQEFIGARPMSMGETFVAVADDINAIYWNPAGLPALNHLGINSMHTNLFNSDVNCNYLALSIPGLPKTSIGVDWMNIGFNDNELEYGKNKFNFSGGYQLFNWLSLGFSVKHIRMKAGLDQISQGGYYGWGSDWGMLCRLHPKWKVGLVVHDFTNTTLKGIKGSIYKQNLRVGAAYQLLDNLLVTADLDDRFHLGSEYRPFKKLLALRAGLQQDFYTKENMTFSFGMGLDIPLWGQTIRFDYAYTDTPTLPNTHRTSLSFLIDLFPRLIKIKKVVISPIYASLYKYHSKNPIGNVFVDYKGKKDIDCTISVTVDKYAGERKKNIVIRGKLIKSVAENIQPVSINTVFNDSILYEQDNIPLIADVKISYMSGNRPREETVSQKFYLYRRNKIDWQYGAEQAAAFITPEDPAVIQFTRHALSGDKEENQEVIVNEQFTKAVRIFNAVSQSGIRYEEDHYSPYSKTYRSFDNILYPAELLAGKCGDCDDLCILFASLLENRNIPTALVSVPGHIFLLFNTGVHLGRTFELCCAENLYLEYQDQLWIPLETTWLNHTFSAARKEGARQLKKHLDNMQIINVREAWEMYKPVADAGMFKRTFQEFPDQDFAYGIDSIKIDQQKYLMALEEKIALFPDSSQMRNQLAKSYISQNELQKAEQHFKYSLANDSTDFLTLNNLGNLFFIKDNLDSAETYYLKALDHAKTGGEEDGICLNLGLLYFVADNESQAVDMFTEAMRDSTDYQRIGDLLGMIVQKEDLVKNTKLEPTNTVTATSVKQIISKASKKKKTTTKKRSKKVDRVKILGVKDVHPKAMKTLGVKGRYFLYWSD